MPETDVEQYAANIDDVEHNNRTEKMEKNIQYKHLVNWCLKELITFILFVIVLFIFIPYRKTYVIIDNKNLTHLY